MPPGVGIMLKAGYILRCWISVFSQGMDKNN